MNKIISTCQAQYPAHFLAPIAPRSDPINFSGLKSRKQFHCNYTCEDLAFVMHGNHAITDWNWFIICNKDHATKVSTMTWLTITKSSTT